MKSKFKNMDKFLFILILIYTILGLVMVFSASSMTAVLEYGQSESYFFVRQLFFVVLAYIAGFIILFMPNKLINLFKSMSKIIAYAAIGILLFTLFFGKTINGATSWFQLGSITIQPSEFVKTMTILFIAFAFRNPMKMFKGYKFLMPFVYGVICVALIAAQPDLGAAMILAVICFFMFLSLPLKDKNYSKYGTPFAADYCDINLDDNIIIYGHHMKNGMMFADLEKYKNKEFYEKNKYIDLFILDKEKTLKRKYEIISVFKILATDEEFKYYEYHNLDEFTDYQDYVNKVKEKSLYKIDLTAEYGEKLLTLSTCEYSQEDGRLVVVAKKIK